MVESSQAGPAATPPQSSATTSAHRRQRQIATVAFAVGTAVLAGWSVWLIHADVDQVIGRRAFFFALLFALIPVAPLVGAFAWFGRLRLEPWRFLLVALLWGALVATLASLRLNGWLAPLVGDRYGISPRSAVFVAPWVEESTKAAVVFGLMWWRRRSYPLVMAGVVYGGLAGVGFAFTENIVYYGQIFQLTQIAQGDNGAALDAVQQLFRWRGVAAPFVHPMFTMLSGLGIGLALRYHQVGVRILAPVAGFCAATLLHMVYNTMAAFSGGAGTGDTALVGAYVGVLLPTLGTVTVVIFAVRRRERQVLAARLRDYSAFGWLQPQIIDAVVAPKARSEARRLAADVSKSQRAKVRAFQRTGVELAVLRDRMVCGAASPDGHLGERRLLSELRRMRRELILFGDSESSSRDESPPSSSW